LVVRAIILPVAFDPIPPTFLALFAIVVVVISAGGGIVEIITIAIHVSPRDVVQAKFAIKRCRGQDAGSVGGEGASAMPTTKTMTTATPTGTAGGGRRLAGGGRRRSRSRRGRRVGSSVVVGGISIGVRRPTRYL
jgi:hypothetical protein